MWGGGEVFAAIRDRLRGGGPTLAAAMERVAEIAAIEHDDYGYVRTWPLARDHDQDVTVVVAVGPASRRLAPALWGLVDERTAETERQDRHQAALARWPPRENEEAT